MANWANPTVTSNYINFVDELKARDVDAITLQAVALTSPPVSSIRLIRSPMKFQEWSGAAFNDLVLSPAGGGTGTTSIAALAGQMGFGSMAYQNSPNVSITGGGISNVTISGGSVSSAYLGGCTFAGGQITSSNINGDTTYAAGYNFYINSTVRIAAGIISSPPGAVSYGLDITSAGRGISIKGGSSAGDILLYIINQSNAPAMHVRGDLAVVIPKAFVLPVGPNMYAAP